MAGMTDTGDRVVAVGTWGCIGCWGMIILTVVAFAGLCVAVNQLVPDYGYTANIKIDNSTNHPVLLRVASNLRISTLNCDDVHTVDAQAAEKVTFTVPPGDSFKCPDSPAAVEFRARDEVWLCAWKDAKRREPVVMTADGPQCDHVPLNAALRNLAVDNRADDVMHVTLYGSGKCKTGESVGAGMSSDIAFEFNFNCRDTTVQSAEFGFWIFTGEDIYRRKWTCDWRATKRVEPVVVTLDGPNCD